MKKLPVIPWSTKMLLDGIETSFQVMKAFNLIMLILIVYFHKTLEGWKPAIVKGSVDLQNKITNIDLDVRQKFQKQIIKVTLFIRRKSPKSYYKLWAC